jgi:cell division transport system permease protein
LATGLPACAGNDEICELNIEVCARNIGLCAANIVFARAGGESSGVTRNLGLATGLPACAGNDEICEPKILAGNPMTDPTVNLQAQLQTTSPARAWLRSHGYSFFSSLGRFIRAPLTHFMTLGVLALALALPTMGHLALKNLRQLSGALTQPGDISLFLQTDADATAASALQAKVTALPGVRRVSIKTPDQALAEFRALTSFTNALEVLDQNPLPFILVTELDPTTLKSGRAIELVEQFKQMPEFEIVQFDQEWLLRLKALINLAERGVWVFGALLALTVLLVIGNTIRLEIAARIDEINIVRLVGATNAFVRRPFLYSGFWFGAFGGAMAVLLVGLTVYLLAPSAAVLAQSYGSELRLQGLDWLEASVLIGIGVLLGMLGALLASSAHLIRAENPQ